jgi:TolB-like protein
MSLINELKRRNVIRMAGLYLVGAWLIVQVSGTVLPMFGAPDWLPRSVVILLALGFVPVLVFAWVFELTPEGIKRDAEVRPEESIAPQTARRMDRMIIVVLLLALAYFGFDKFVLAPRRAAADIAAAVSTSRQEATPPAAPAPNNKSIAVLPFENMSADKDNAFFADGIQDEILTGLATIGDLKVISRTSTLRYDSKPPNLVEIARQLGVANILEGSVQKVANRVRVNVQLIEAQGDSHLWAETYDRTLDDVFAVQSEVAQKIAEALKATLTRDEHKALTIKPTENPAAYEAYLKAVALIPQGSAYDRKHIARITDALEQAVKLDPNFALAWAFLADRHLWCYFTGFDSTPERLTEAKAALERAEAIAPDLPQAHFERAMYKYYGQRDFAGALELMPKVQHELPNNPRVWYVTGLLQRRLGQWAESVENFEHARRLSPNDFTITTEFGLTLVMQRRYAEAVPVIDAALDLRADDPPTLGLRLLCAWNLQGVPGGERVFAAVKSDAPGVLALRGLQALYQRDDARAAEFLGRAVGSGDETQTPLNFAGYIPARVEWLLMLASVEKRTDSAAAEKIYRDVQSTATAALAKPSSLYVETAWRTALAMAEAGLGQRDKAVAEAQHVVALVPEGSDLLEGPTWQEYLAKVYAMNGDAAHALPLVEHLLKTNGNTLTSAMFKLDPVWDPIRQDARLQKLVDAGAAAAQSEAAVKN